MHVGPIDQQLAVLHRLMDTPSARVPVMTLASAAADAVPSQAHSPMITPPATSVQMLVAIAAATPSDDRRPTVEAERGRSAAERFRRLQGLGQSVVAQAGAIEALEYDGDEPAAARLIHEAELRLFEELAKIARNT